MFTAALIAAVVASMLYRYTRPINYPFLGDTFGILRAVQKLHLERRFPRVLDYNVLDAFEDAEFDYPPLVVLLLSLFTPATIERRLRLVLVANDLPCMLSIGTMAWLLSGRVEIGLVSMSLYSFTPSIIGQSLMLTSRTLSIMLFTISTGLMLHYVGGAAIWFGLAGAAVAALLLLCNALSIQAWMFVVLTEIVVSPHRWQWAAYALLSLLLCYLIAGRIAWRAHRGLFVKLAILKKYRMDDLHLGRFHLLQKIRGVAPKADSTVRRDLRIVARSFMLRDYPFLWILGLRLLGDVNLVRWNDVHTLLAVLLGCHLCIDSIPSLRFIGPAPRYLNYAFLPMGLLIGSLVMDPAWGLPARALLVCTFILGLAETARRQFLLRRGYDVELEKMRDIGLRLRDLPVDRVLALPTFLSDALGYYSGKTMMQGWASRTWGMGPRFGFYPVIERPLNEIISVFDLGAVVIEKDYVRFEELNISNAQKLADNGKFEIYAVSEP